MNPLDDDLIRVHIAEHIWELGDKEKVRERILSYLRKTFPYYVPVKVDRPCVLCRDERRKERKKRS